MGIAGTTETTNFHTSQAICKMMLKYIESVSSCHATTLVHENVVET